MILTAFSGQNQACWDGFVRSSRNGTLMQERKFLNYHPPGRFADCSLMARDSRGGLTAVIPAAAKYEENKKIFYSHPGASHGGIVVGNQFRTAQALTLVSLLIEQCGEKRFDAIELKMIPRIYHRWPTDEIDFALRQNGFSAVSTELATALPLKEIGSGPRYMAPSAVRSLRRAEKSEVYVEESADYEAYWAILTANLRQRHNSRPTHSLTEIDHLIEEYPGEIKLFAAFHRGEMVGGVTVFLLNNRVVNCFYIAHDDRYQGLRPLNLVFFRLVNWAVEKGYHYLDWGISTENRGRVVNYGLFRFKETFGGRGVLRETYRYNFYKQR